MLKQCDIESLDEDSAQKLHIELCEEGRALDEEAFRVYKHLRMLRRRKEIRLGLVDQIGNFVVKPTKKPRERTGLEKLVEAANKKGINLIDLLNE